MVSVSLAEPAAKATVGGDDAMSSADVVSSVIAMLTVTSTVPTGAIRLMVSVTLLSSSTE